MLTRITSLFVVSVLPNFLLKVAQMPLHLEDGDLLESALHCIVPRLGGSITLLVIFSVGWTVQRRSDWSDRPGINDYACCSVPGSP